MKSITERVMEVLEQHSATAAELVLETGLTKKQVEGVAFRLRNDGKLQRGTGGTATGVWSVIGQGPTRAPANTNGMGLGDLYEVVGTLKDGTWTIRSLDAPHTIYALKEVQ